MPVYDYHESSRYLLPIWQTIRDVLDVRAVKDHDARIATTGQMPAATTTPAQPGASRMYLPKLPGQKVIVVDGIQIDEYLNYLRRAVLLPYAGRVLNGLTGMVFRKEPVIEVPSYMEEDLDNLTLSAPQISQEGFAKMVFRENASVGYGAILVDYSAPQDRPYQRLYIAESIGRWRHRLLGSQPIPVRVPLKEDYEEDDERRLERDPFATKYVQQWRVLELVDEPFPIVHPDGGTETVSLANLQPPPQPGEFPFGVLRHQLWRELKDEQGVGTGKWLPFGPPTYPLRKGRPLGFIPIVPFTPWGLTFRPGKPTLQDLCDLVLAHYLNSADYENNCHFAGMATLFVAGADTDPVTGYPVEIRVGGSSAIVLSNPQAKAEYVLTGGRGGTEILAAMDRKERQMAIVAARLLLAPDKKAAETEGSQAYRMAGDDANLQDIAGTTAMALEEAMRIHAWWAGAAETVADIGEDVRVDLNDDFVEKQMTTREVFELVNTWLEGGIDQESLFWNLKKGERLPPELTFEEYKQRIEGERTEREAERTKVRPFAEVLPEPVPSGGELPPKSKPVRTAKTGREPLDAYLQRERGQAA